MANEKLTLLKHLQLTAMRCSAMVTGKISELTAAVAQDLEELDNAKQDKLTFDTTPKSGSTNPVTSGGVYSAIPTKTSQLTNDSGFKTTDTTYSNATTSAAGLMSASDKSKLDGISTGANKITVDSALSSSSTNPVQNKVINTALSAKQDKLTFDTVPTSGSAKPITSGGVYAALGDINTILDEINGEVV